MTLNITEEDVNKYYMDGRGHITQVIRISEGAEYPVITPSGNRYTSKGKYNPDVETDLDLVQEVTVTPVIP